MIKTHKKKGKIVLITLIVIALGAMLTYLQYRSYVYSPIDETNDTEISFQIKKGSTPKEIGRKLEDEGLIASDMAFYLYTKFSGNAEDILAGRFLLKKSMNVPEILAVLSDPSQAEFIITIQEGLQVRDIDQKLVDLGLTEPGEFIKEAQNFSGWEYYDFMDPKIQGNLEIPVEGYLYPDTYYLDPIDFEAHDLIYLAIDNFESKTQEARTDQTLESSLQGTYSFHEIIIMASIIENEVFGQKDRTIVSGILWKRLENDWTLGADATLLYITEDRTITAEDLEKESPYNTRKFKGLPPGPISNPSLESIEAALSPELSQYWFYLTTPDTGEVIYAETNDEHNQNREKYL